jgi:hypothetical protein
MALQVHRSKKLAEWKLQERRLCVLNNNDQGDKMKKYLMIICTAAALVGCANNQGGMSDRSTRETGSESYDRSSTTNSTSSTNSSTISPANSTEKSQNSGSQGNSSPQN